MGHLFLLTNRIMICAGMISTRDLGKRFEGITAVEGLTLEIGGGEVFGFLGPNGAGKTTTVRMLTGLIAPSSGSARILGYELGRENQEIRRRVGLLTEAPGHYARLSAWQNLTIYARLYEVDDVKGQVEKYLRLLALWERRDDPAGTFSKGMRQKLAIARALLHEPPLLFLDEPTAGLDPEAAHLIRDFIAELKEAGRTIFLCTHNLEEADRLCDRVAVFKQSLRVIDTPAALRRQIFGRGVTVQLAQSADRFQAVVSAVNGVHAAEAVGNALSYTAEEPEATNPEVIRSLVNAGAAVQFVGEQQHSLEAVYLRLLNEETVQEN